MSAFFNILLHSIGSLFLGVLITLSGMALMLFIIKSWHKNKQFTTLSFLIAGVLFLILSYHSVIICGAVTIKGCGNEVEKLINSYVSLLPGDIVFSQEDSQAILENLKTDLPLVGHYANWADFTGHTPADIAHSMNEKMQSFMNEYIVKHSLWILAFVLLGAFLIIKTMDGSKAKRKQSLRYTRRKNYDDF